MAEATVARRDETTAPQQPPPPRRPAQAPRVLLRGGLGRGAGLVVAALVLGVVSVLSVLVGNFSVGFADVIAALDGPAESDLDRVVRHVRIPRTVTGLLVGAALGIAGAVMQGLTRNPLAGPGILGVNAGSALAVVLAMALLGVATVSGYIWFAFVGAAVAAVFVYFLGSLGHGGATPVKLALAGAAFTALVGAVTTAITLLDASTLDDFRFWVVGSLTRAGGTDLVIVTPFIVAGAVAAVVISRALNAIALGDDMASSLGTKLMAVRAVGALSVVLLAGAATAVAGPVGFVGLVIPHIARMITGPDYRWLLPWCVLLGPIVLLLADVLGRVLVAPQQLQVGIITALAGAPFFLYLVRNRKVPQL
ncbi:FecCD family ABC transporter permease [Natronosporangium hydrolyticum]|uniref:FecCD family ABC transporter permease n=1 Tax=Natronosporangium hydrolyticum TaxID=2811111 RepID=UPI001EFA198F|nr:iron ABC transporter permease [Natronosporangium hydrolyticum]